jgi:ribonucleoside-diphosphate reductase alpha chain
MTSGIPYDSTEGRAICGALTAIMTGVSYATSAEMARELGPFPGFEPNRDAHAARHAQPPPRRLWRGGRLRALSVNPVPLDHAECPDQTLIAHAKARLGSSALDLGEKHGYRNAQTTVIAPTGTIGLVMDCDTTGIEPDFALVKFKKLAGGGYFKIINRAVPEALRTLGYSRKRDRRDRGLCGRPRLASTRRPASTPAHAEGQGLHRRQDRRQARMAR